MIDADTFADGVLAMLYYSAPSTYDGISAQPDPPCGDFRFDFGDEADTYGQIARAAVRWLDNELGTDVSSAQASYKPDRDLMQRLGIDLEQRYNPPPLAPDDEDYRPVTECCKQDAAFVDGPLKLSDPLSDSCPLCHSPQASGSDGDDEQRPHRKYMCKMTLLGCGHYLYPFFDFGATCAYLHTRRASKETGVSQSEIFDRFHAQFIEGGEAWGRVRLKAQDDCTLGIHVYRKVGYDTELPEQFEGLAVTVEQLKER